MIVFKFRRFFRSIKKLIKSTFYDTVTILQDHSFNFSTIHNQVLIRFFNFNKEKMINSNKGK